MSVARKIRHEEGFALPLALSMMVIVAMFAGVTISFATHNTDRAIRDSASARALGAADAGLDAAVYRMNKALIGSQAQGILPVATAALAETKCVSLSVGSLTVVDPTSGWCPATTSSTEQVDGAAAAGEAWQPASFTYSVSTGVNIGSSSAPLIQRKVVAIGTVDDVQKRVMATVHATLGSSGNLLTVFEQVGYKQCTSVAPPSSSDPAAGC
jgi:Tfp pilus assembly protein PilX